MLTYKHYVAPSSVHGLGLFTDEDLVKDQVLWKFCFGFDVIMSEEKLAQMPQQVQDYMHVYGWLERVPGWQDADGLYHVNEETTGMWHVSVDGDKYTNHSDTPNTYMDELGWMRAVCDIPKGTEITANYYEFDSKAAEKLTF